jgi:MFS transporter, PAT family, beta-lactamase induction signal transducer AmpG
MSRTSWRLRAHFALFASLYALQGVVVAYFFNFNQVYMVSRGVSRPVAASVQSLALVPFILKFLVGPLSDRVNLLGLGHRRPYILLGLIVQTAGLIGLALLDPGRHLGPFSALAVLTVVGLALYDTCCDGMVIDVTPPEDRDRLQATLVASRALAAMVCSYGFGLWVDSAGQGTGPGPYQRLLWACAGLGLIPLVQAIGVSEPIRSATAEAFQWGALRALIRPRALVLLAFGAIYSVVSYGVEINLAPYYDALGYPAGAIGGFAALRYVGRAVGAALLPLGARKLGRGWLLTAGVFALAAATAGQVAITGRGTAGLAGFAFGAANGWTDALFYVLAMEASDPRMAASTYALFMAVTNVSVLGGAAFARLDESLGGHYRPTFLASALATLAALILVPSLARAAPRSPSEPGE